jgi:putative SOS response-associated peptidase YedK
LIPASGFYEWQGDKETGKEPWFLQGHQKGLLAFAGVWQAWTSPEGERQIACAIVTASAGNDIAHIHHREPVIVDSDDYGLWLGEEGKGAASLMQTAPDGFYKTYRVSHEVNSARHDRSQLMDPMA